MGKKIRVGSSVVKIEGEETDYGTRMKDSAVVEFVKFRQETKAKLAEQDEKIKFLSEELQKMNKKNKRVVS